MMSDFSRRIYMRTAGPLALTAVLATSACGAGPADSATRADGSQGEKTDVTAAMYPLQWLAGQVGGPDVTVTGLTKPGAEPHDLELAPTPGRRAGEAELVVYIKGVQPAVDEAVRAARPRQGLRRRHRGQNPARGRRGRARGRREEHGTRRLRPAPVARPRPASPPSPPSSASGSPPPTPPTPGLPGPRGRAPAADLGALDARVPRRACATCAPRRDRHQPRRVRLPGRPLRPHAGRHQRPRPRRRALPRAPRRSDRAGPAGDRRLRFHRDARQPQGRRGPRQEVGAKTAVLDPLESQPAERRLPVGHAPEPRRDSTRAPLSCS